MARFYAEFDHSQDATLNADLFDIAKIGGNATEGGNIRAGLIASRSALSAEFYVDSFGIERTNRSGAQGTIIPGDVITVTAGTNPSVSMSFSAVYTASTSAGGLAGIITPANYRTRPTASILSTFNPSLLGRPLPIDSGSNRNYNLFLSASNAVSASLSAIITGSNTPRGPYVRLGANQARTLHSIWHDADLNYFAWDDFTPGQLSTSGMTIATSMADCNQTASPGATSTIQFQWHSVNSYQFKNDGNGSGRIGVEMEIAKAAGATGTCDTNWGTPRFRLQLGYAATTHGGPLTMGTSTSGNGQTNPSTNGNCGGTSTWTWNGQGTYNSGATPSVSWTVKLEDCISPGYEITVSTLLFDATITTNTNTAQPGIITTQVAVPNTP